MLLALTKQVMIIEAAIVVVIVALLVAILVLNQKKRRGAKVPATASATASTAPSYYADLQQERTGGQPDPFAGFSGAVPSATAPANGQTSGAAPATNGGGLPAFPNGAASNGTDVTAEPVSAPPADPPAFQAPAMPPVSPPPPAAPGPGTPAGWLPDPSGVADTLRYWDGSAWTQHVAQRTGAAS